MKKRIGLYALLVIAALCFFTALYACNIELFQGKSALSSEPSLSTFTGELDLYEKLNMSSEQNLRLLDATPEKILYEVVEERMSEVPVFEGIADHTCKVGVYLWKEQTISFETSFEENLYISSGTIQDDRIFLVGIVLDERDDHFKILECDPSGTNLKMEGTTIPYFTQWPELCPWNDREEVLLWIPYRDADGKNQAQIYLISQNKTKELQPPFAGELLSGNDLLFDKNSLLTFWEIENTGKFLRWDLKETVQTYPLPEEKRILDYVLIKDGVLASLQTDEIHSELCFLPFEGDDIISLPSIPLFRMTVKSDQNVFCVDGRFQLYEILLGQDNITLTPIDLSSWIDPSGVAIISILSVGDGSILIQIENQGKILVFQ